MTRPIEGTFVDPGTVELRTGQRIIQVQDASGYTQTPFMTGWLAGGLYVSHDNGTTWGASELVFRTG